MSIYKNNFKIRCFNEHDQLPNIIRYQYHYLHLYLMCLYITLDAANFFIFLITRVHDITYYFILFFIITT